MAIQINDPIDRPYAPFCLRWGAWLGEPRESTQLIYKHRSRKAGRPTSYDRYSRYVALPEDQEFTCQENLE